LAYIFRISSSAKREGKIDFRRTLKILLAHPIWNNNSVSKEDYVSYARVDKSLVRFINSAVERLCAIAVYEQDHVSY